MPAPFKEAIIGEDTDSGLIDAVLEGDAHALEALILRHQAWIYNIAFKMTMDHENAEDITQEILIKVISHLGTYDPAKAAFRTWLYRIVVNHVLNMKKKKFEVRIHDFDTYVSLIEKLPDQGADAHPESAVLAEEMKIGCMMGMLLCLKRPDRMAFLLGAVFGVRDEEGADLMAMSRENFRQKLSRSRKRVFDYMNGICGHVNSGNPCRCVHKVKAFADMGMLDAGNLRFHQPESRQVKDMVNHRLMRFENTFYEPFLRHFRSQPFYSSPDMTCWLRRLLENEEFKNIFNLNNDNS